MIQAITLESESVSNTLAIGHAIGLRLRPSDVVGLSGCLGAGKTHLIKGIARGLGVQDERIVSSPTFVLVNEYEGRWHVYHLDAYRLHGAEELDTLGFEEMCGSGGIVLVEWADRVVRAFAPETLWIDIQVTGDSCRRLELRSPSSTIIQRFADMGQDR